MRVPPLCYEATGIYIQERSEVDDDHFVGDAGDWSLDSAHRFLLRRF